MLKQDMRDLAATTRRDQCNVTSKVRRKPVPLDSLDFNAVHGDAPSNGLSSAAGDSCQSAGPVLGHRSCSPVSLIDQTHVRHTLQPTEITLQRSKLIVCRIAFERYDTNVVSVTSLELLWAIINDRGDFQRPPKSPDLSEVFDPVACPGFWI